MPAERSRFDPEAILAILVKHQVDCVVIGGIAASLQGSPFPTIDVDITPRADLENFQRLSNALDELDAKVRAENTDPMPFRHNADSLIAVSIWNLTTKYGDLDITTTPSGTTGYDDLRRDAVTVKFRDIDVLVASLAAIVRSKGAANRLKDQRVMPVLRELLGEQTRRQAQSRRRK